MFARPGAISENHKEVCSDEESGVEKKEFIRRAVLIRKVTQSPLIRERQTR